MQEQPDSLDKEVLEAEKDLWKLHAHQLNKKKYLWREGFTSAFIFARWVFFALSAGCDSSSF